MLLDQGRGTHRGKRDPEDEDAAELEFRGLNAPCFEARPWYAGEVPSYEALRLLSRRGPFELYEGVSIGDRGFRRRVTLELLRSQDPKDEAFFARRNRLGGRLEHPHIITVLDCSSIDGVPCVVLEPTEGIDAQDLRHHMREREELASVVVAIAMTLGVARALAYLDGLEDDPEHARVAEDHIAVLTLKDLLLCRTGGVKIMDIGAAVAVTRAGASTQVNTLGALLWEVLTGQKTLPIDGAPSRPKDVDRVSRRLGVPKSALKIVLGCLFERYREPLSSALDVAGACATALWSLGPPSPEMSVEVWHNKLRTLHEPMQPELPFVDDDSRS